MHKKTVTRRSLLDLLQSEIGSSAALAEPSDRPLPFEVDSEFVTVLWRDNQLETEGIPDVVLVERDRQRDFFAWITTFVPFLRPFTAYCRVVEPEVAEYPKSLSASSVDERIKQAWAAVILTEAVTHKNLQRSTAGVNVRSCQATVAYCIARNLTLGMPKKFNREIPERWAAAKDIVEHKHFPYLEELRSVWEICTALTENASEDFSEEKQLIHEACAQLMREGSIGFPLWHEFTRGLPELENSTEDMRGTRENRVVLLERLLSTVSKRGAVSKLRRSFVCGYLTSRVAPGTLDHIRLLDSILPMLPSSAMWYGLSAGLNEQSAVKSYGNSSGRRVLRELSRPATLLDAPVCDVALDELRVLINARGIPEVLKANGNLIEVEITPCVAFPLRWSQDIAFAPPTSSGKKDYEFASLLRRVEDVSRSIELLKRDLMKEHGNQATLEKDLRKKRG